MMMENMMALKAKKEKIIIQDRIITTIRMSQLNISRNSSN